MTYTWFYVFNTDEFDALGLVSKVYKLILEGRGRTDVLVTKGETFGITYNEEIFLPLNLNSKNPFEFEDMAIYSDADNNVFMGFLIED
jgi:hypothetical protein